MLHDDAVRAAAAAIADGLASPTDVRNLGLEHGWWPQSLALGAVGVALLHIERALAGVASWQRAHDWLACAIDAPVTSGDDSHLYYGAPAIAFALNAAAEGTGRYRRARDILDHHVAAATRRRVDHAHARIDRSGELPALAEFDAVRGLAGVGAYLLHREAHQELLRAVLAYLVRLTEPVKHDGELRPGWWSGLAPSGRSSPAYPGGHANNGVAHGIGGPLALLGQARRRGITVDGQVEAIGRICVWLDQWRQDGDAGPWWPYWVTRAQLRDGRPGTAGPSRPSWCYGTAGLARAQQLAAIATGDAARQRMAEDALVRALIDPGQLAATVDLSLCHGYAGLAHIAGRAAADAITPDLAGCLPRLLNAVVPHDDIDGLAASLLRPPDGGIGLLEGAAGVALALHTAHTGTPPVSGWDSCLLIN
ncbi:MAG: lantibiotic biosynthesis protein [Micromonosporaceae bacterium]|nr:lantibiotic biosynthesis protein [Micromonosporaceae bacterium]